jgi:hypothetical protein
MAAELNDATVRGPDVNHMPAFQIRTRTPVGSVHPKAIREFTDARDGRSFAFESSETVDVHVPPRFDEISALSAPVLLAIHETAT